MRFDLVDLRLFLSILETGSITHGAARANLSLPSASARLRGMEDTLGMPLLERGRRGVESTPTGDTLAHHARLVLGQIERMQGELGEHQQGRKACIRLWTNSAALTEFLPSAVGRFLRDHPNVQIDLKERQSSETVKGVLTGAAEIGIISDAVEHGALQTLPFAVDKLVLITSRDDPLAGLASTTLAEAGGREFIGLSADSSLQAYLGERALMAGRTLSIRTHMRTFDGICCMVEQGAGIGIVSAAAARRYRGTPGICTIDLADPWATRQLLICMRDLETMPRAEKALVQHLTGLQGLDDGLKGLAAGQ
ncbi:LysR family transcriptional regulator [Paraburkholderia sp. D15]|uniref:LysR family transcriptional regulator n=1 Tax=Paraburkholderia sp. D15 TaxID=2880218 RepID=UPI00247ADCAB|nr:LysR family transcriptional regulator [Paraburkholderia sp. D15]WGS51571.1 LysR family transcriptional regulator [Paraburkholderia sp. D15]WKF55772.1 HTH-type transcriptional regulator CysL [Paraburkholderia busanensis]